MKHTGQNGTRKCKRRPLKENVRFNKVPNTVQSEAHEFIWAIDWAQAWDDFVSRKEDGGYKYSGSWDFANRIAVGKDEKTRKRRADYIYAAIGPKSISSEHRHRNIPWFGDWNAQRSSGFLGELRSNNLLFGSPTMKTARDALRKQMDIMAVGKGGAEMLWNFVARYQMWSQQVDEMFDYRLVDPSLPVKENEKRFDLYTKWINFLRRQMADTMGEIMNKCFGVDATNQKVLLQMALAMVTTMGDDKSNMILRSLLSDSAPTIDGKTGLPADSNNPFEENATLRLTMSSFLEKASSFHMRQPDVHIDGVPDEDDQEKPIRIAKRKIDEMVVHEKPNGKSVEKQPTVITGHGTAKTN